MAKGCRELHAGWTYEFWDDARFEALIRKEFPELLSTYRGMSGIKRADVARLAVMAVHGGVYLDLDVQCIHPLDDLLESAEATGVGVILGEENHVHAALLESQQGGAIVSNAVLISVVGHSFWRKVIKEIRLVNSLSSSLTGCGSDPVECTGPRLLERLTWRSVSDKDHGVIVRLPYDYFYADLALWNAGAMEAACDRWTSDFVKKANVEKACRDLRRAQESPTALRTSRSVLAHQWQCSWCREDEELLTLVSISAAVNGNLTKPPKPRKSTSLGDIFRRKRWNDDASERLLDGYMEEDAYDDEELEAEVDASDRPAYFDDVAGRDFALNDYYGEFHVDEIDRSPWSDGRSNSSEASAYDAAEPEDGRQPQDDDISSSVAERIEQLKGLSPLPPLPSTVNEMSDREAS
jgi:hypothetical protein